MDNDKTTTVPDEGASDGSTDTPETLTPEEITELRAKAAKVDEAEKLTKQYKSLQKQLEKARRGNSSIQDYSSLQTEFNRTHALLGGLYEALGASESIPAETKAALSKYTTQVNQSTDQSKVLLAWKKEADDALDEYDLDWDDPRLNKARGLWDKSNFMAAIKEIYRTGKLPDPSEQSDGEDKKQDKSTLDSAGIEKMVNDALKKQGVRVTDTKETTVPGRKGVLTRKELADVNLKKAPKELAKDFDSMLDKFYPQ